MLGDALDKELKEVGKACLLAINTGATTKLEFRTINALVNLDKKQATEEVKVAEREFSTKFKLRKEDHMHPSVLKKRTEFLK